MKQSEMKGGMPVYISSTNKTQDTHTVSAGMKLMVDKIYKIKYTANTRHGLAAIINGYYWHSEDLSFPKVKIEKPKIQHFDIKELVI